MCAIVGLARERDRPFSRGFEMPLQVMFIPAQAELSWHGWSSAGAWPAVKFVLSKICSERAQQKETASDEVHNAVTRKAYAPLLAYRCHSQMPVTNYLRWHCSCAAL